MLTAPSSVPQSTDVVFSEPAPQRDARADSASTTPTPGLGRMSYDDALLEPRFSPASPRRASAARWIVGLVVLGMGALAFATVGQALARAGRRAPDARVGALLADGEKSLARRRPESAKEQFDKASVLGEREPRTVARTWRASRRRKATSPGCACASCPMTTRISRRRAASSSRPRSARARRPTARPRSRPPIPSVVRSRIDALRLSGDLGARAARRRHRGGELAARQRAHARRARSRPRPKPDWPTVLGRLRAALTGDGNLGRARAMLVYALARSGDAAGAKAELERLSALAAPARTRCSARCAPTWTAAARARRPRAPGRVRQAAATAASRGPRDGLRDDPEPVPPPGRSRPRASPRTPVRAAHTRRLTKTPITAVEAPDGPSGPIDTSDSPGVKAPPVPRGRRRRRRRSPAAPDAAARRRTRRRRRCRRASTPRISRDSNEGPRDLGIGRRPRPRAPSRAASAHAARAAAALGETRGSQEQARSERRRERRRRPRGGGDRSRARRPGGTGRARSSARPRGARTSISCARCGRSTRRPRRRASSCASARRDWPRRAPQEIGAAASASCASAGPVVCHADELRQRHAAPRRARGAAASGSAPRAASRRRASPRSSSTRAACSTASTSPSTSCRSANTRARKSRSRATARAPRRASRS